MASWGHMKKFLRGAMRDIVKVFGSQDSFEDRSVIFRQKVLATINNPEINQDYHCLEVGEGLNLAFVLDHSDDENPGLLILQCDPDKSADKAKLMHVWHSLVGQFKGGLPILIQERFITKTQLDETFLKYKHRGTLTK